jgi:hypothetical protein
MTEKPILFSAPMVRAILDGRKSQTRRIIKPQPVGPVFIATDPKTPRYCLPYNETLTMGGLAMRCPYGQPGDRLWVRETCRAEELPSGLDGVRYLADDCFIPIENTEAASDAWLSLAAYRQRLSGHHKCRKMPAIHMPRWASRITLEITGIRMERLQDISESDALAEGIDPKFPPDEQVANAARMRYADIWESINSPGSWAANPWVWVVEFRRMK